MDDEWRTPLVVDLDGTLTPTDTLHESVIRLLRQSPLCLFHLPGVLLGGRAHFKEFVASRVHLPVESLPYRPEVLAYLREQKARGRRIVLATAAHESIAAEVAAHLGLFDEVLSSRADHNLKGTEKLDAIRRRVGADFVYAGDSKADLPIWQGATAAVLVDVAPGTRAALRESMPVEREFPGESPGLDAWLRAFRVHQWLKNVLLFVPLLTAFSFLDLEKVAAVLTAFVAFSLAASATYMVNDLWDLENDRQHPRKRLRPFASGRIPIHLGLLAAGSSLTVALVLGLLVSQKFLLMLLVYIVLTAAYSWKLKSYVLVDVLTLAVLYTHRILAGSVVAGVTTSSWLLAFSVFIFLSLSLVKRCAELVTLRDAGRSSARGRDYRVTDLTVLCPLGVGAALASVVVFGLFIQAPETVARYASPQLLWLVALALVYWLGRLWVKTSRGEMHDDPVVYAIKDRGSRLTVAGMIAAMLSAHFLSLGALL